MQPLSIQDAERIVRAGAAALQQGRAGAARAEFEKVAASGRASAQVWLLLAHACRETGDAAGAETALDDLLAKEPQNLWGLIQKGDARAAAGDRRAATAFHKKARQVAAMVAPLPGELAREMERVERALAEAERHFKEHLEQELGARGFGPGMRSPRFQQSLDILAGEKQIYFQQPTNYFFPELPQIQFFDRALFPWVEAVEAAAAEIRTEVLALLEEEGAFQPYMVAAPDRPRTDFHGLADNPDWSSLYLWENGRPVEANVARCPKAYEALLQAPMPHISTRAPVVMFSRLKPGARIPAHTGMLNARLICHLPLVVPPGCGFRVGNEVRAWEEGKLLIFDDTIEHEAWNDSEEDRIVLIFDIWRPELSAEERSAVVAMFESVDSYGG
jgi:aspartyl/asparaginyl beta-hydroxylase (cupin superfamily)